MPITIDVDTYLKSHRLPAIDVRSAEEFDRGHVPDAINIPILDGAKRAEIGLIYKNSGRQAAMMRGLELVSGQEEQLLESVRASGLADDVLVYCWRGGMRSEGFAWLLARWGYRPRRLFGGYKAFRSAARRCFEHPRRILILAGYSGAGKTRLLSALHDAGQQVIDLEHLAGHRGSVFGGIQRPPQPTVEQFENRLFLQWRDLDPDVSVWIECESRSIGRVFIPPPIWNQMSLAPAIIVEVDLAQRVEFLVQQYGDLPTDELARAVERIRKRLGGARVKAALMALEQNDMHTVAELALQYYDKAYTRELHKRSRPCLRTVRLSRSGQTDSVGLLSQLASEFSSACAIQDEDAVA